MWFKRYKIAEISNQKFDQHQSTQWFPSSSSSIDEIDRMNQIDHLGFVLKYPLHLSKPLP